MNYVQALKKAKDCLASGSILPTKHFRERMAERQIGMSDVRHAINTGILTGQERDVKTGEWKYTLSGKTLDGEPIKVVFAITGDEMDLITCMRD
jgi:hypothetical protein